MLPRGLRELGGLRRDKLRPVMNVGWKREANNSGLRLFSDTRACVDSIAPSGFNALVLGTRAVGIYPKIDHMQTSILCTHAAPYHVLGLRRMVG